LPVSQLLRRLLPMVRAGVSKASALRAAEAGGRFLLPRCGNSNGAQKPNQLSAAIRGKATPITPLGGIAYQETGPFSSKNPPLRLSSLSMTRRAMRRAGFSGDCVPVLLLRSVLVKPGATQKIVTPSFFNSSAQ
jgi:hypothetical protein